MNGKKAKRARQLVRQLINGTPWTVEGVQTKTFVAVGQDGKTIKKSVETATKVLDPLCGRAVYQKLKAK